MMELIRADLSKLNIRHDVFFSERTLHGQGKDIDLTIDWLREQGLVYQGRLEKPKGVADEDWEDREQTLFRAKDFGDDTDRALLKSDGSYTYFAADIAYHRNKVLRGFNADDQRLRRRSLGLRQAARRRRSRPSRPARPRSTSRSCSSSGSSGTASR